MVEKLAFYSCGLCRTKNAFARRFAVFYNSEYCWPFWILRCRRCGIWKEFRDGITFWRGVEVESAALTFRDLPQPGRRKSIAEAMDRLLSDDLQVRAEMEAQEQRIRPYLVRRSDLRRREIGLVDLDEDST